MSDGKCELMVMQFSGMASSLYSRFLAREVSKVNPSTIRIDIRLPLFIAKMIGHSGYTRRAIREHLAILHILFSGTFPKIAPSVIEGVVATVIGQFARFKPEHKAVHHGTTVGASGVKRLCTRVPLRTPSDVCECTEIPSVNYCYLPSSERYCGHTLKYNTLMLGRV